MAALLFLFLMSAFGELLEVTWKQEMMESVSFMKAHDNHIEQGQLHGHKFDTKGTFQSFVILFMIYVDDTAIPFTSRAACS